MWGLYSNTRHYLGFKPKIVPIFILKVVNKNSCLAKSFIKMTLSTAWGLLQIFATALLDYIFVNGKEVYGANTEVLIGPDRLCLYIGVGLPYSE